MAVGLVEPGGGGRRMPGEGEHEPSLQEIVVALRDAAGSGGARAAAGGAEPATNLYRLQPAREVAPPAAVPAPPSHDAGWTAGAAPEAEGDPRDTEIARLVAENHRLNQRLFALLKAAEQVRGQGGGSAVATVAPPPSPAPIDRDAVARAAREAIRRELTPLLTALVKLLDANAAAAPPRSPPPNPAPPRASAAAPLVAGNGHSFNWVVDLLHAGEPANGTAVNGRPIKAAPVDAAPAAGNAAPARLPLLTRLRRLVRRRR